LHNKFYGEIQFSQNGILKAEINIRFQKGRDLKKKIPDHSIWDTQAGRRPVPSAGAGFEKENPRPFDLGYSGGSDGI
jgi:hypothetical protein